MSAVAEVPGPELLEGGPFIPATGNATVAPSPAAKLLPASHAALAVVTLGTSLALLTGGLEGSYWLAKQQLFGSLVFLHPHFPWMAPLVLLAIFALPTLILAAHAGRVRSSGSLSLAVGVLSLLAWLNLILLFAPGLHFGACLLLSAGLATAIKRGFEKQPSLWLRRSRQANLVMLVTLGSLMAVTLARDHLREQAALAQLPTAPADSPNVLMIVLDTVRADALALLGEEHTCTPNLAELARRGTVFEQAWSTAPWTLPSMAGMFTGRLPHQLSTEWLSELDAKYPTLAEKLSEHGWHTAGFVGNTRYCSAETGLARGFTHYEDYQFSPANFGFCSALGRKLLCSNLPTLWGHYDIAGRKRADELNQSLLNWLDERRDHPYFAFVNYWDAHDPYFTDPAARPNKPASDEDTLLMRNWWWIKKDSVDDRQLNLLRTAYEECLHELDHGLGNLLEELEARGELDNTLILVTADHGEHFGEHGLQLHGNSLYEPLLHVPLIVVWPERIPAGERITTPVSLQSLPSTFQEILQLGDEFPGDSLAGYLLPEFQPPEQPTLIRAEIASQAAFPPCHGNSPVAAGSMQCARLGPLKYILNGDGLLELYDLARDPTEADNLVFDERFQTAVHDPAALEQGTFSDSLKALLYDLQTSSLP